MLTLQAFLDIQNFLDNVGLLVLEFFSPKPKAFTWLLLKVLYNTYEYVIPFSFYYLKLGQNYEN